MSSLDNINQEMFDEEIPLNHPLPIPMTPQTTVPDVQDVINAKLAILDANVGASDTKIEHFAEQQPVQTDTVVPDVQEVIDAKLAVLETITNVAKNDHVVVEPLMNIGIPDVQDVIDAKLAALDTVASTTTTSTSSAVGENTEVVKHHTKIVQLTSDDETKPFRSDNVDFKVTSSLAVNLSQPEQSEQESTLIKTSHDIIDTIPEEPNEHKEEIKSSEPDVVETQTKPVTLNRQLQISTENKSISESDSESRIETMVFTRSDMRHERIGGSMSELLSYTNPTYSVNDLILARIENSRSIPPWRSSKKQI